MHHASLLPGYDNAARYWLCALPVPARLSRPLDFCRPQCRWGSFASHTACSTQPFNSPPAGKNSWGYSGGVNFKGYFKIGFGVTGIMTPDFEWSHGITWTPTGSLPPSPPKPPPRPPPRPPPKQPAKSPPPKVRQFTSGCCATQKCVAAAPGRPVSTFYRHVQLGTPAESAVGAPLSARRWRPIPRRGARPRPRPGPSPTRQASSPRPTHPPGGPAHLLLGHRQPGHRPRRPATTRASSCSLLPPLTSPTPTTTGRSSSLASWCPPPTTTGATRASASWCAVRRRPLPARPAALRASGWAAGAGRLRAPTSCTADLGHLGAALGRLADHRLLGSLHRHHQLVGGFGLLNLEHGWGTDVAVGKPRAAGRPAGRPSS
jgi:hypothetical protein